LSNDKNEAVDGYKLLSSSKLKGKLGKSDQEWFEAQIE
jgi:hypothetical protein